MREKRAAVDSLLGSGWALRPRYGSQVQSVGRYVPGPGVRCQVPSVGIYVPGLGVRYRVLDIPFRVWVY